jgi:predicted MFS family arabinose efflux permease
MAALRSSRKWQNLWVRLAVALAFADASIVVLALPQIVDRLHTSISHVVWVIVGYNLALIVTSAAVLPVARKFASRRALISGLAVFGLASIVCGVASSFTTLLIARCFQGAGGAVVLCASLPLFAGAARPGDSPLYGWSAAAAVGAAVGPAAGGLLTQLFDWRSIFLAQAPIAALAAVAVMAVRARPESELDAEPPGPRIALGPLAANAALTLLSAGLIGALFLVVIELINAWLISPIGAAAIVTTIPLTTALAERLVRGRSPLLLGGAGAILVAAGLVCLALASYRALGLVVFALALCGTGLGLGFPGLTTAALRSAGTPAARAAKTVAARDAGLVLGLLVLTPVFVHQLNATTASATSEATGAVIIAPIPDSLKFALAPGLQAAATNAPQSSPPNIAPVFDAVSAHADPADRPALATLRGRLETIVQHAATHTFKRPFLYAATFAFLVLPLLAAGSWLVRLGRFTAPRATAA